MIENENSYSRLNWLTEEEKLLRSLKEEQKIESWKIISKIMNSFFPLKSRTGKQCRERYMNHVRFGSENPKNVLWSVGEELSLFESFIKHGPKWVVIAKEMPGRSENCLKNRFYGAIRKTIRRMEKVQKEKKLKFKKLMKVEFFVKILEFSFAEDEQLDEETILMKEVLEKLRKILVDVTVFENLNESNDKTEEMINLMKKFNDYLKNMKIQMKKNESTKTEKEPEVLEKIDGHTENIMSKLDNDNNEFFFFADSKPKINENIILVPNSYTDNNLLLFDKGYQNRVEVQMGAYYLNCPMIFYNY